MWYTGNWSTIFDQYYHFFGFAAHMYVAVVALVIPVHNAFVINTSPTLEQGPPSPCSCCFFPSCASYLLCQNTQHLYTIIRSICARSTLMRWHCTPQRVVSQGARRWWRTSSLCRASSTRPHTDWEGVIKDGMLITHICIANIQTPALILLFHAGHPMINSQFSILEEKTVHSRYFDVLDRRIQFPSRHGVRY